MSEQIFPAGGQQPGSGQPFVVTGSFVGPGAHPTADASEQALRRYLLTRALGRSIVNTVLWSGLSILALAVLCWFGGVKVLAVLIGIVAILVLLVRAMLARLGRRLSGSGQLGAIEPRVDALVSTTRRGLRRELRRVGLPGTPLLIALRLIRPLRRAETLRALTQVDLKSVVPADRLDELHLLLQSGGR